MSSSNHPEQMDSDPELQGLLQDMVPGTKVTITRCLSSEGDQIPINGRQKASIDENLQIRPTDIVTYLALSEKHSDEMRRWTKELHSFRTEILARLRNGGCNRIEKEVNFEQFLSNVLQSLDDGWSEIVINLEDMEDKWETNEQRERCKRVQQFYMVLNRLNKKKLHEMYCEIRSLEQDN